MTDRIDTAKERRKLDEMSGYVLLMCPLCPEEMNCHTAEEMAIGQDGVVLCADHFDEQSQPGDWMGSPNPVNIAIRALSALDAKDAEIERLRSALRECILFADGIADAADIDMDATHLIIRVRPSGLEAGRRSWADVQAAARAALNPEGET